MLCFFRNWSLNFLALFESLVSHSSSSGVHTTAPQKKQGPEPSWKGNLLNRQRCEQGTITCEQTILPHFTQLLTRLCFCARHWHGCLPGRSVVMRDCPSALISGTCLVFFVVAPTFALWTLEGVALVPAAAVTCDCDDCDWVGSAGCGFFPGPIKPGGGLVSYCLIQLIMTSPPPQLKPPLLIAYIVYPHPVENAQQTAPSAPRPASPALPCQELWKADASVGKIRP